MSKTPSCQLIEPCRHMMLSYDINATIGSWPFFFFLKPKASIVLFLSLAKFYRFVLTRWGSRFSTLLVCFISFLPRDRKVMNLWKGLCHTKLSYCGSNDAP